MIGEPITKALLISTAPKLWPQRAAHVRSNQNFKGRRSTSPPIARCNAPQDAKPPCVHASIHGCVRACVRVRECAMLEAFPRQLSHIADQSVDDALYSRSLWIIDQTGGIEYGIDRWCYSGRDQPSRCHQTRTELSRRARVCGTHWALGASEHPGLSGPDLQMSSPGTARLGRHYHSSRSSNLLTASPYSSSWTFHSKRMQVRTEMNSPCSDVSGEWAPLSASVYVEQKWQQRFPIWGDADAQPEGLASCLSHLAPSAHGEAAPCDWNHRQDGKHQEFASGRNFQNTQYRFSIRF